MARAMEVTYSWSEEMPDGREVWVEVDGLFTAGTPARPWAYGGEGDPGDPGEIEVLRVRVDGKEDASRLEEAAKDSSVLDGLSEAGYRAAAEWAEEAAERRAEWRRDR